MQSITEQADAILKERRQAPNVRWRQKRRLDQNARPLRVKIDELEAKIEADKQLNYEFGD